MVMGPLVFDRDGLFHQSTFFEFVAVNQGATIASLLVYRKFLRKVGIDLPQRICCGRGVAGQVAIQVWIFVLILGVIDVFSGFGDGRACTFLPLPLSATGGIECRSLFFWLESSDKLAVYETVVHHATGGPVDGVSPAFDPRGILFIHKNGTRGKHLCSLFVVGSTTDMAESALKCGFNDGHGVFCGV